MPAPGPQGVGPHVRWQGPRPSAGACRTARKVSVAPRRSGRAGTEHWGHAGPPCLCPPSRWPPPAVWERGSLADSPPWIPVLPAADFTLTVSAEPCRPLRSSRPLPAGLCPRPEPPRAPARPAPPACPRPLRRLCGAGAIAPFPPGPRARQAPAVPVKGSCPGGAAEPPLAGASRRPTSPASLPWPFLTRSHRFPQAFGSPAWALPGRTFRLQLFGGQSGAERDPSQSTFLIPWSQGPAGTQPDGDAARTLFHWITRFLGPKTAFTCLYLVPHRVRCLETVD